MGGRQKAAGPLPVLHAPWDSVSLAPSSEVVAPVFASGFPGEADVQQRQSAGESAHASALSRQKKWGVPSLCHRVDPPVEELRQLRHGKFGDGDSLAQVLQ
jgi:hypothetical protein